MSIDSSAVFADRVNELGLGAHHANFEREGWSTFASFAFATSYIPGTQDEAVFLRDIVVKGLGREDHPDKNALRRLFFESYTLTASDLKRRVEAGTEDAPRKVSNLEREERRSRVDARLTGVDLVDELDCSNRLIDKCIDMYEENAVRYLGPEQCTKLEMELKGMKKDPMFAPDQSGFMRMRRHEKDAVADVTSDIRVQFAFKRRSLALEMGDVMSFENSEKLTSKLIRAVMAEPPPGFAQVDLDQILRADLAAWKLVAERTRKGIKRDNTGYRPCDRIIDEVLAHPEFCRALQPLPSGNSAVKRRPVREDDDSGETLPAKRRKKSQTEKIKDLKSQMAAMHSRRRQSGPPPNSAAPQMGMRMPKALIGKLAQTSDRPPKRLCFAYNMRGGCRNANDGQECPKGWHLCMEPPGPCAKAHPCHEH